MATIAAGDAATPYRMMAFGTQFGPRVINAIRAMNNIEGMKDPGAAHYDRKGRLIKRK